MDKRGEVDRYKEWQLYLFFHFSPLSDNAKSFGVSYVLLKALNQLWMIIVTKVPLYRFS